MKLTDITANVPGMMVIEEVRLLMDCAKRAPEGTAVEVGAYLGLSACAIAAARDGDVYSVDPFETRLITSPIYPKGFIYEEANGVEWRGNIERMGFGARVTNIRKHSTDAAQTWTEPVALLLIDADHNNAVEDVAAWGRFVMLGGYLLLHDRNEPAVEAAMDAVAASGEWEHIATANLMVAYKRVRVARLPDGTPLPWTDEYTREVNAAGPLSITPRPKPAKPPARKGGKKS
jgi:predicted O-methyltransferase YrrM